MVSEPQGGENRHEDEPDLQLREVVPVERDGTLFVDLDLGSVRIETHDEALVSVEASASGWAARLASFSVERKGDDIFVDGDLEQWLPGLLGGVRISVRIKLPRAFAVDVHTGGGAIRLREIGGRCAADSSGGPIELDRGLGPVMAITGGGPIRVSRVGGDVRARTGGGPIDVRDVVGDVDLKTLAGPVHARDIEGRIEARSAAGPINASFAGRPGGALRTAAGSIVVRLPPGSGAELDAQSVAGGARVERSLPFEGRRSGGRLVGRIGPGGASLVLRSTAGGIRVRSTCPPERPTEG